MPCRQCELCARRFGTGIADNKVCIFCGGNLTYSVGREPTVTPEEYKAQLYVKGKVVPGPLTDADREAWDADWSALEAKAELASPWLSVADLLAAWPSVRSI